jgi:Putative prokaryotic signal transducing protein
MSKIDWDKEQKRLEVLYARLEDAELQKIGSDPDSLTEVARQVLGTEMSKRGMTLPANTPRHVELPSPVAIRRYRDLPEASIAKSILDSAGIQSLLVDDNLVRLDWFYSNLVGGIKVLVRQEDVEAAVALLAQEVPETFDVEGIGEYEQPRCPQCQSFDVSLDGLNRPLSYATLWAGFPVPVTNKGWKCHSCGNEWTDEDSPRASVADNQ